MKEHSSANPILSVENSSKLFIKSLDFVERHLARLGYPVHEEVVHAVDSVSFELFESEVIGLVGESGCGKSTLGQMIAGLLPASSGQILYRGKPMGGKKGHEERADQLKIQMIFQDPFASLNPRMKIEEIIGEAPLVHKLVEKKNLATHIDAVLHRCGLDPEVKSRYPHQFSGGQRQRIGIARALAVNPDFIVCDESVASLDVSIQAQILNLFMKLQRELHLSYLFISHDIGVVKHISDRILIMYLGRVVESSPTEELFASPNHPYTQVLLREVPDISRRRSNFKPVAGEIPSPLNPPTGCHFHPRCPYAFGRCKAEVPMLKEISSGRMSACHLNEKT